MTSFTKLMHFERLFSARDRIRQLWSCRPRILESSVLSRDLPPFIFLVQLGFLQDRRPLSLLHLLACEHGQAQWTRIDQFQVEH